MNCTIWPFSSTSYSPATTPSPPLFPVSHHSLLQHSIIFILYTLSVLQCHFLSLLTQVFSSQPASSLFSVSNISNCIIQFLVSFYLLSVSLTSLNNVSYSTFPCFLDMWFFLFSLSEFTFLPCTSPLRIFLPNRDTPHHSWSFFNFPITLQSPCPANHSPAHHGHHPPCSLHSSSLSSLPPLPPSPWLSHEKRVRQQSLKVTFVRIAWRIPGVIYEGPGACDSGCVDI